MNLNDVPNRFLSFCTYISDQELFVPLRFDRLNIDCYVNHSLNPNIAPNQKGQIETLRLIKAGEEILFDYNQLGEPEALKPAFYHKKNIEQNVLAKVIGH